jgi:hypothetical protein
VSVARTTAYWLGVLAWWLASLGFLLYEPAQDCYYATGPRLVQCAIGVGGTAAAYLFRKRDVRSP